MMLKSQMPVAVAAAVVAVTVLSGCSTPAPDESSHASTPTPSATETPAAVVESTAEPAPAPEPAISAEVQAEVDSLYRTAQIVFYSVAESNVGEPIRKVLTAGNEVVVMLNERSATIPLDGDGWVIIMDGTTDAATVTVGNSAFGDTRQDYLTVNLVREGLEMTGTSVVSGFGKYAGAQPSELG